MKYLKLTTEDNDHNGLIFKENELITDPIPMTPGHCEPGGIYFTDEENWTKWIDYSNKVMYWLWDCKPVGEVITFDNKYKAQSVILTNPRCIWEDPELQLAAVQQYSSNLYYIKNPSEAIQLAAIRQNGSAIKFIKNPSEAIQLAAVQKFGQAIRFIKYPSEDVQLAAVQQDGRALECIRNPSEAIQLAAVQQYSSAMHCIEIPSEAVQLAAVKQDGTIIRFIKNSQIELIDLILFHNKIEFERMLPIIIKLDYYKDRFHPL